MDILEKIAECILNMGVNNIKELVKDAIEENINVEDIYEYGLNKGMIGALDKFENKEYYLSEVIVCTDALNKGISILKGTGKIKKKSKGVILMSVVEGDTHEIGKNIVKVMVEATGYKVIDLGVNRKSEDIIEEAIKNNVDIIGLSSMMTTTMENMKSVINKLNRLNLSKRPKVIIGGGPVSMDFAEEIGADGYSPNAPKAVKLIDKLIGGEI
ncbi:cobalamin B12-binding domain-containing protein [Clostridioides sp. ES-S-0049-02]|uniref:cobalamin B12-binding domain-containing protein n=1 Tax=Clostridioides sp. ES-S-0049-02 TaxID=2770778 RepID=UPI001D129EB0|nr:cobalamin B12-binding domain-containing protein [Clostridioides sp. ES-S-0049-02]